MRGAGAVTLTIKYAVESLVKRQIKLWGGERVGRDSSPMNSDSFICDLVLAKQFEGLG
jgi:hypothetical protein